jgi:plastocyanin
MSDEPTGGETPSEEPVAEGDAADGGGVALAVREETTPAIPMGPAVDPHEEAKKTRLILPFLVPVGAILVVAFFALNISRIFLAASEESTDFAVLIASVLTLAILIGATVIAAIPSIRTSSLVIGMSVVALGVMLTGSLVLGASLPKEEAEAGFVEPAGPATNTLEVDALPDLTFQAKSFDVPAGVNLIKYIDKGGAHTLVFDKNAQPGFQLAVPDGKSASKVELKEGTTYVIFCTIPGHREAGMEADINVGPAAGKAEPGTQSPTETTVPAGTTPTVPGGGNPTDTSPAQQSNSGE